MIKRVLQTALASTTMVVLLTGCEHAINPFVDETLVEQEEFHTPSERKARAAQATPIVRRRQWQQTPTTYPSGAVVHWPLWFEDPFEDKGSEDGKYAWTFEDYIAAPYSFGRVLVNTIGWPVSAVVTPPGTPMVSDGRLSKQALGMDHDAIPLSKARARAADDEQVPLEEEKDGQMAGESDDGSEAAGPPYLEEVSFEQDVAPESEIGPEGKLDAGTVQ